MGGDKVQEVVEEKSGVSDIRGAVRPLSRPPRHPPQRFQAAIPRHCATITPLLCVLYPGGHQHNIWHHSAHIPDPLKGGPAWFAHSRYDHSAS